MYENSLRELSRSKGFPRISIYFPTHKHYPETQQDSIRLSKALLEAERQLKLSHVRSWSELLSEARAQLLDVEFWRHQDHGLAIFIEAAKTQWLRLPIEPADLVVVADRYHILPLIGLKHEGQQFHLLAVTQGEVRFFDCSEQEIDEIVIERLPGALADIKAGIELQSNVGYHTRGSAASPKYHALGTSAQDYEEVELRQFVHDIAKAVDTHLQGSTVPLVLAAGPRVFGMLKHELKYRHLAPTNIQREPAFMTKEELHHQSWTILQPLFNADKDKDRARLEATTAPRSENLQELMHAADEGRISKLFVEQDAHRWGHYDDESRSISFSDNLEPGKEDLLNLLALKVLEHGGTIETVPKGDTNHLRMVLGFLRY